MTVMDQLTPEQAKAVYSAPMAASIYVSDAGGGAFEMVKEMVSATKFLSEGMQATGGSGYGELVDDLLASLRTMSKDELKVVQIEKDENTKDMTAMRLQAKQAVTDAWAAVSALPGADGYAKWVLEMARTTALTKTGGHFGIGNKSVIDEKEQAALDELAQLLGGSA